MGGITFIGEGGNKITPDPPDKKCAIVLGIRSGTSMTTEMIIRLGFYMGKGFQPGNIDNPRGYFEDNEMIGAMINMGMSIGAESIHKIPDEGQVERIPFKIIRGLKESLESISYGRELWGFKRPAALWYLDVIELFVENPYYVLCVRNRDDVIDSIRKHEAGVPHKTKYEDSIKAYFDRAEKYMRTRNHIVMEYEETLRDPLLAAKRLAQFLGVKDGGLIEEASNVVKKEFNHHADNI